MLPGKLDLALYRGNTVRRDATIWLDDGHTQAADLADATPKSEIRDKPGGKLLATFTCTVELPNIVHLELPAAVCATLPSRGAWDLQLTYGSGDVWTPVAGKVSVTMNTTDSAPAAPGLRQLRIV
jgi:hypothetical protein